MKAGEGKHSGKQGVKKSDRTIEWCNLIIEELKTGEKTSFELEQKFGIKENLFPSLLMQLTYIAPIYDYKVGGKLVIGMLN